MTIQVTLTSRTYNPSLGQFITTYTTVTGTFRAAVATQSALPVGGNVLYDVRIALDNNHLYCWNGTAWVDVGVNDVYDYVVDESIPGPGGFVISEEESHKYAFLVAHNSFRLSQNMNSQIFQMEDGIMDWYDDESYVDLINSVNQNFVNYFGTANYYTPVQIGYVPQNMEVQSIALDSNGVSGLSRLGFLIEEIDSIILNIDIKVFASRDGGMTWTETVLEEEGNCLNNFKVIVGDADFSSQPEDLHIVYKIQTYNNKNIRIYSSFMSWL